MTSQSLPKTISSTYRVDHGRKPSSPSGRNVFILIDGTWNSGLGEDGNEVVTNIRKLYECLGPDSPTQISRYFRGVGNSEDHGRFKRFFYGFTGRDEKQIRLSIHAAIAKDYQPGDHLFILGFSRGAACARRLASHLDAVGIPDAITIHTEHRANLVTRQVESRFLRALLSGDKHPVRIAFLGCFDTVGAFVLPLRFPGYPLPDALIGAFVRLIHWFRKEIPFSNLTLAANVEKAVHCVAIDETRNAFTPTLMNAEDRVEEVWFPGVHADVGGGYASDGLGRLSLEFMMRRIEERIRRGGFPPLQWNQSMKEKVATITDETFFDFHFHGLRYGLSLLGKTIRNIHVRQSSENPETRPKPKIHRSVQKLWQSNKVRAEVEARKKKWPILYSPFNIRALNRHSPQIEATQTTWPFDWID